MDDGGYGKDVWIKLIALVALALASFAAVVIDVPMASIITLDWLEISTRVALLIATISLIYSAGRTARTTWRRLDVSRGPGPPKPDVPLDALYAQQADIIAAIRSVHDRYQRPEIALFTRMLTRTQYFLRVTERAELAGNSMRMHVSTDFVISRKEREQLKDSMSVPVPLLKVNKGTLLDNLDVTDGANSSIPLLSQHETRGLVALALEGLFYLAFQREPADTSAGRDQMAALWNLHAMVCRMGRFGHNVDDFRKTVENLVPTSSDLLAELEEFCSFFAVNYVVVADVPTPTARRFIVKYSKTNALDIPDTLRSRWRARLGLVPYQFRVPLNLAFTAESYHFRMDVGDSQFVDDHSIVDPDGRHLKQEGLMRLTGGGYVRVRSRSALPYAHLYTRKLDKVHHPIDLVSVVRFTEIPPGALGATTVVAGVSALLIMIMTFVAPAGNGPNADTSALLLAVPLFAATLVGHSIERVQRSSIGTYVGLFITGVIAFLSATAFGLLPDRTSIADVNLFGLFMLPSVNLFGAALSAIGALTVFFLFWRLRYQTSRYLRMFTHSSKPGPS